LPVSQVPARTRPRIVPWSSLEGLPPCSGKDFPLPETRYADGSCLEHNPTWHEMDSVQKGAWIERFLRKTRLDPHTVAEVGCGAGGILAGLQRHYPRAEFVATRYLRRRTNWRAAKPIPSCTSPFRTCCRCNTKTVRPADGDPRPL